MIKICSLCCVFWENVLLESQLLSKGGDFVAHMAHHMLRGILTGYLHAHLCLWHSSEDPFLPSIPTHIFLHSSYNLVLKCLSLGVLESYRSHKQTHLIQGEDSETNTLYFIRNPQWCLFLCAPGREDRNKNKASKMMRQNSGAGD